MKKDSILADIERKRLEDKQRMRDNNKQLQSKINSIVGQSKAKSVSRVVVKDVEVDSYGNEIEQEEPVKHAKQSQQGYTAEGT